MSSVVDRRGVAVPLAAGHYRHDLPDKLRGIFDLVETLGYTRAELTKVVGSRAVKSYWLAKRKIRSRSQIEDAALRSGVELRDLAALQLIEQLEYSQAEAARVVGLDDSHLGRRLREAKKKLRSALAPPNIET